MTSQWLPQETGLLRSQGIVSSGLMRARVSGPLTGVWAASTQPHHLQSFILAWMLSSIASAGLWSSLEYNTSWEHEITDSWGRTVSSCGMDPDEGRSAGLALWRGPCGSPQLLWQWLLGLGDSVPQRLPHPSGFIPGIPGCLQFFKKLKTNQKLGEVAQTYSSSYSWGWGRDCLGLDVWGSLGQ